MVIGTEYTENRKSNYYTITTTINDLADRLRLISDCCLAQMSTCSDKYRREDVTFGEVMVEWCTLCTRPTRWVGFYNGSSATQQPAGRHLLESEDSEHIDSITNQSRLNAFQLIFNYWCMFLPLLFPEKHVSSSFNFGCKKCLCHI